jgi:hypothetical protein
MNYNFLNGLKKYYPYFIDIWQYLIIVLVVLLMLLFVIPNIK